MKNTKGITLIALIITIIVMLILVATGVDVAIKEDLIGRAQKAVTDYNEAVQKEKDMDTSLTKYFEELENKVEASQYIEEVTLVCIYTDNLQISFKYDGNTMYDITDSAYKYNGKSFKRVFGYVISGEFDKAKLQKQDGVDGVEEVIYDGDVNLDGELDFIDAMAIMDVINKEITEKPEGESVKKYLKGDYDKDKKFTKDDAEGIMNKIAGK